MLLLICTVSSADAQVNVSGSLDLIAKKHLDKPDYTNLSFAGQSPFRTARTRLFFDAPISDNVSAFVQLFSDNYRYFSVYAAYVKVSNLAGPYLNIQAGRIPNTIGSFGPRTYASKNPLIGVPLVWVHHSSFDPGALTEDELGHDATVTDLLALRDQRPYYGLPILYDFCWNSGVELFGSYGKLDYSLGMLAGSVGSPLIDQTKEIPQFTTHLQYYLSPGFVIGGSGFWGPYLTGVYSTYEPDEYDFNDYTNGGAGYEIYIAHHMLEFYSEGFWTYWEYPYLPTLYAVSGYAEAKYKFTPGWYAAGRFDIFRPNKIADDEGGRQNWDYPLKRYEFGIGYKPDRSVTLKLVTQINRFDFSDAFDYEQYALQMAIEFQ